jgi:hypothetical protein
VVEDAVDRRSHLVSVRAPPATRQPSFNASEHPVAQRESLCAAWLIVARGVTVVVAARNVDLKRCETT